MQRGPQPLRRADLPHGDAVGERQVLPAPRAPWSAATAICRRRPRRVLWLAARLHPALRAAGAPGQGELAIKRLAGRARALGGASGSPSSRHQPRAHRGRRQPPSTTPALADHLAASSPPAREHAPALPAPRVGHGPARAADGPPRGLGPAPRRHLPGARRTRRRPPAPRPAQLRVVAPRSRDAGIDPAGVASARRRPRRRGRGGQAARRLPRGARVAAHHRLRHRGPLPGRAARRGARLHPRRRDLGAGRPRSACAPAGDRRAARRGPAEHQRPRSTTPCEDARACPTACGTRTVRSPTSGRRVCCGGRCSRPGAAWPIGAPSARPTQVFELRVDEVAALLTGAGGPSRAEIERARRDPSVGGHPRRARDARAAGLTPPADVGLPPRPGPHDAGHPHGGRVARGGRDHGAAQRHGRRRRALHRHGAGGPRRRSRPSPPWSRATSSWRRTPRPPTTRCWRWPAPSSPRRAACSAMPR